MAKRFYTKKSDSSGPSVSEAKQTMTAPKRLMLLFTVVNRAKTELFVDLLQGFEVNMQMVLSAHGTANEQVQEADRNKSQAVFMTANSVGSLLASFVGGWLFQLLSVKIFAGLLAVWVDLVDANADDGFHSGVFFFNQCAHIAPQGVQTAAQAFG